MEKISVRRKQLPWWHSWKHTPGKSKASAQCFSSGGTRRKRGSPTPVGHTMSEAHLHPELWPLSLASTSALIITALLHLRGWLHFRRAFPSLIPTWRLAAFIAGLFSVWTAVASPLAELDHQSLTFHMAKHLLLMTVASPLLLAGTPTLSLVHGPPKDTTQSGVSLRQARWLRQCLRHLL